MISGFELADALGQKLRRPVCVLNKLRVWIFALLFAIILFAAASIRFSLPPETLLNPDSWGFLAPGLIYQETGVFPQTNGRNFLYPVFLKTFISSDGTFDKIAAAQHLLGLASGILWILLWGFWIKSLHSGVVRSWLAPLLGLLLVAMFLLDGMALIFEHHIRAEGIFPFAAILQLLFIGITLRNSIHGASVWKVLLFPAAAVFFTLAAISLKPSWTLTICTLPLLVVIPLIRDRSFKLACQILSGLAIGCGVWILASSSIKSSLNWQPDSASRLFLPKSLVSVHADKILAHGEESAPQRIAEEAEFFQNFQAAFLESKEKPLPYLLLGFNPDHIFYETKALHNLPGSSEEGREFLLSLYFSALRQDPASMASKWGKQFYTALRPKAVWIYRSNYQVQRDYARSAKELRFRANHTTEIIAKTLLAEAERADRVEEALPSRSDLTILVNHQLLKLVAAGILPAVVICLLAGLLYLRAAWIRNRTSEPTSSAPLEAMLWACTLLSAVGTVAIVHSFDIDRYAEILTFLFLLVTGAGTTLLLSTGEQWLKKRLARQ